MMSTQDGHASTPAHTIELHNILPGFLLAKSLMSTRSLPGTVFMNFKDSSEMVV